MAHLKLGGVVLLLFLSPLFTEAQDKDIAYYAVQLDALQAIWAQWNKSTPNLDSNLAGWSSTQKYPCSQTDYEYESTAPNWRGIECAVVNFNETNGSDVTIIIGLSLHNASIAGHLPADLGHISSLTTLELTGNPKLTGLLNQQIMYPYLHTLDLSDNQFNHTVPTNAFISMAQLISLDLSMNELTGPLPNLAKCRSLQSLVLSNNSFNGSLPDLRMLPYLNTLKLAYNNLTGNFPLSSYVNTTDNKLLSLVDLSGNQLTGSATGWNGSDLTFLEELYLDNTGISGTLDITQLIAGGLVQSQSVNGSAGGLRTLSIMNNNISDVIYTDGTIENITTLIRLQGNPYCRKDDHDGTRCFCEQYCKHQGSTNNTRFILRATITSTLSAIIIIGVVVSAVLCRAQRYKRYLLLQVQQKFEAFDVKPTIFSFNELKAATRDFHPDMKLGEGSYGCVYKGVFPNKSMVAVKQLFVKNTQGIGDFLNEVVLITGMKHKNLVNLKGCCLREHQRLLVYEYVDNYDIDQVLLRGEHKTPLGWVVRLNICLGVARGLHYLHSLAHPKIIHRDIKASNILLAKNFEPKIADFGLALLFPDEKSHIMTLHVAGTKGYLAPEYALFGQLSDKVDVFSFGILCLEVLSGRRNIDKTRPPEEVYLSDWAWKLHKEGRLMELVDPTLILQDDEKPKMHRLINIALLCSQHEAKQRPNIARVVAMLQYDTQSEVVVVCPSSNSGTSKPEDFGSMNSLTFEGSNSELTTMKEELDNKLSLSYNAQSSTRALGQSRVGEKEGCCSSVKCLPNEIE